jgi:ADP-ribose pyrophosphatase YjhB (NUDIX family)
VSAAVVAADASVYLVKRRFSDSWQLPGGAVEANETVADALRRVLSTDYKINITFPPILHGIFLNTEYSNRNYITLFVVRDFLQENPLPLKSDVVEHGFFRNDCLPSNTTSTTRARLAELFDRHPVEGRW